MLNKLKKIKSYISLLRYRRTIARDKLLQEQRKNPLTIPVIIINFNQLYYLRQLIDFLLERQFQHIVIVDNNSDYPPLMQYYLEMKNRISVEYMENNYGHMVFFREKSLQQKYGRGYFFLTDADILPNPMLPTDFAQKMLKHLDHYFKGITKVGFALDISDIPDHYPLKNKVLEWEGQFWKMEVEPQIYKSSVDTTFALYKPGYPDNFNDNTFLQGIRLAGNFTAKHGGWYVNPENFTEENLYFINSVSKSSTWKLNSHGEHDSKGQAFSKENNNE